MDMIDVCSIGNDSHYFSSNKLDLHGINIALSPRIAVSFYRFSIDFNRLELDLRWFSCILSMLSSWTMYGSRGERWERWKSILGTSLPGSNSIDCLCGRYRFSLMLIEFWRREGRWWWDAGECWESSLIVHFKRWTSLSCLRLVGRLIDFSPIPIDIASIGIDYDQFSPSYALAPALFSLIELSHHESVVRSVTISITFLRFECAEYDVSPIRSRSILLRFRGPCANPSTERIGRGGIPLLREIGPNCYGVSSRRDSLHLSG